jgi:hypothetical protein
MKKQNRVCRRKMKRAGVWNEGEAAIWVKVIGEGLLQNMTLEQRPGAGERGLFVDNLRNFWGLPGII